MARIGSSLLRPTILHLSEQDWFRRLWRGTRPGRAVASRFVAGESLAEAIATSRRLHASGLASLLDHLGENVRAPEHAIAAANAYIGALERIGSEPSIDCAISIKLTQLGLELSRELCLAHVLRILEAADSVGTPVMIDMEASWYVERTLEIFRQAHVRHPGVGVCLQSYLRRTDRDVFALPEGCRVRLVKGAYLEEPDVVLTSKRDVDRNYAGLLATLYARGHAIDVATHDPKLIEGARRHVQSKSGDWTRVEFQMLYGIRQDLQRRLAREGYPVRVYVPYGTEWYPYLTRRLAERPANLWFFLSNAIRALPVGSEARSER
jgi:proline dehydrogenase